MSNDSEYDALQARDWSEPAWTREWPTEPGWYWYRLCRINPPKGYHEPMIVELVKERNGLWGERVGHSSRNPSENLWWPVPLQPPESSPLAASEAAEEGTS